MAISTRQNADGVTLIRGFTKDTTTEAPLGVWSAEVGAHYIGVDDRSYPPVVRVFHEPTRESSKALGRAQGASELGYVVLGRISINGEYISATQYWQPDDLIFERSDGFSPYHLSFVSQAKAKLFGFNLPYYALTSLASGGTGSIGSLGVWPQPAGCILLADDLNNVKQVTSASAIHPIDLGIGTPSESQISEQIDLLMLGGVSPILRQELRESVIAGRYAYELALELLASSATTPLTLADVASLRVSGKYTLLYLQDPEDEQPALACSLESLFASPGTRRLEVWFIPWETLDGIQADSVNLLVERAYSVLRNRTGGAPLLANFAGSNPLYLGGGPIRLGYSLTAIACASLPVGGVRSFRHLSGVTVETYRDIDPYDQTLGPLEVYEPDITPTAFCDWAIQGLTGPVRAFRDWYDKSGPVSGTFGSELFLRAELGQLDLSLNVGSRGRRRAFVPWPS